jgi:hypothetical protein
MARNWLPKYSQMAFGKNSSYLHSLWIGLVMAPLNAPLFVLATIGAQLARGLVGLWKAAWAGIVVCLGVLFAGTVILIGMPIAGLLGRATAD